MSAFDRLPGDYRGLCLRIAYAWQLPNEKRLSVQNRRIRFAADSILANEKTFPNRETRQQRRAIQRPWKKRAGPNDGSIPSDD